MVMRPALTNVMVKAAEKAARGLTRDFGEIEHLQISKKGPGDFVSTADFKAQKIIREVLSEARPDFGFLMEEKDEHADTSDKKERWIVDPLDGTRNFLHGIPHWCISIAAERNGEIVAGVIYNPISDELFWAEKGIGAYLNNKRLRVSGRGDLGACLFAYGIPLPDSNKGFIDGMKEVGALYSYACAFRRSGSCALDMAYVAAGRLDGYWETEIKLWDCAAGGLLIKEAGGFISPIDPKKDAIKDCNFIATNQAIHDKVVGLLRKANA